MIPNGKRCQMCRQILVDDELGICEECECGLQEMEYLGVQVSKDIMEEVERN